MPPVGRSSVRSWPFRVAGFAFVVLALDCPAQVPVRDLPGGREKTSYQLRLPGSGGLAPYRWTVAGGQLPPGLALEESSGELSGTLERAGEYQFTIELRDARGETVRQDVRLRVEPPKQDIAPLRIKTVRPPPALAGKPYHLPLAVEGGVLPIECSIAEKLPGGLEFDPANCEIKGTPKESGSFNLTVTARDAQATPAVASQAMSLTVQRALVAWWWLALAALLVAALSIVFFIWFRKWWNEGRCPDCNKRKALQPLGAGKFYCRFEKKELEYVRVK